MTPHSPSQLTHEVFFPVEIFGQVNTLYTDRCGYISNSGPPISRLRPFFFPRPTLTSTSLASPVLAP